MLISVIVPVYNVRPYIAECLDSIVSQSYKDLEIIIVDDGSTDGSSEICREYAEKDSRILIISQDNAGVSAARNAALAASSGSFITFVDSDDTLAPDAFQHLVEGFETDPYVRIVSGMRNRFKDGTDEYTLMFPKQWYRSEQTMIAPEDLQRAFLSESTAHFVTGLLFARELFFNPSAPISFKPGIVDEDTLIMYHIANMMEDNGWSLIEVPYIVYNYRIRHGSLCNQAGRINQQVIASKHSNNALSRPQALQVDYNPAQPLPLRVYRLRNLDFIAQDLRDRGREDLLPLVKRLHTRTLYLFLREILRTPSWQKEYWHDYQNLTDSISTTTAYRSLSKSRFCRFMAYKHTPSIAVMSRRLSTQMTALFF